MRRIILGALILVATLSACKKNKDCPPVNISASPTEIANLKSYIETNSIDATQDPRGFYYNITKEGSGAKPNPCSNIEVNYVGKLTNGTIFDQGNGVKFPLGGLIIGWQEGIPLVGSGGSITLYLPPSLAYGSAANGPIPANSNLIFTIDLKGIY
jgi:FKBP-type peptidyl-prolyl cis-trans isomerase FkpA